MSGLDAKAAANVFDPDRLRLARQLRKLKRVDLARLAGVSPAAISQYEAGKSRPRSATLAELAMHLSMPVGFFASTGRVVPSLDTSQGFFRSLRSTTQADRDAALAQAAVLASVVEVVEHKVVLPELDLPQDLAVQPGMTLEDVEGIAAQVRARWELGEAPVANVVRTLERHGVIVARLSLADKADAFSWLVPARPLVILGIEKGDRARSRLDAAHELGHLVMHFSDPEPANQLMERQAFRFGAAFLLPAEPFAEEFEQSRRNWTQLVELKKRWQVSLSAMLYRAKDLSLLSASGFEAAMKQMSRRGWRVNEPGDLGVPERPKLLGRAFEVLEDSGTSVEEVADSVHLPADFVRSLVSGGAPQRPRVHL